METELISSQLAVAYATSSLLEWLKHKPWFPLMQDKSAQLNRAMAMLAAFITAIGVHWVSDWQAANGVLTITISGLTWANIGHGFIAWIQQYAMQQGFWKVLVRSDSPVNVPAAEANKGGQ